MVFKKYPPSNQYGHLVAYFWTLKSSEDDSPEAQYRFVPDGYVDWVFHLGTPWQCDFPDASQNPITGRFHIFGQIKKHINLSLPDGDLDMFGVKFHPWVAGKIWKMDMHYLTDSCLDLTSLDLPYMEELQEKIYLCSGVKNRMRLVENYLWSYLNLSDEKSLLNVFSNLNRGNNTMDPASIGIGSRRLEQRFKNEIGISPKLFLRTLNINDFIGNLRETNGLSLTQLSIEHNYYDQSHLLRDFRKFTGLNPTQFLKSINPNGEILNLRVD